MSCPLSDEDMFMCTAAQSLTASIAITDESLGVGVEWRPEQAVERSVQALGLAEGAARALNEVTEETQAEAVWQSLIRAYTHAADAASSMHPNVPELHGTGHQSLSAAREALDGARTSLPPICFAMAAS